MKSLKLNAFFASMVKVLNIVFPLITGPYVLRILSKENISIFNFANTLAQLFIPLAGFGVYTYGLRQISKVKNNVEKRNRLFSELFYLSICTAIITSFVYYGYIYSTIQDQTHLIIYTIVGIQILLQFLSIEWVNQAFENYSFILYKTIIIRITMLVLIFSFIKTSNDIMAYVSIVTISEILNMLVSFVWIKKDIKLVKVKISRILRLVSPLFTIVLLANINMLYTYLDRFFLAATPNKVAISDYVIAMNIVMLITGVISGAVSVNIPRLSAYLGENNYTAYNDLIYKGSQTFLFFVVPIAFGLMILGSEATLLYGGDKFLSAGIVTAFFAFRAIVWALDNILGIQIIFTKGYERNLTLFITVGGLTNLLLNYLVFINNMFAPVYYIATTIIAEIVVVVLYTLFIRKRKLLNILPIFKNLTKYFSICLSFFVVSYVVNIFLPHSNNIDMMFLLSIAVKVICCSLIYGLILYKLKDNVMFEILQMINKKIRKVV